MAATMAVCGVAPIPELEEIAQTFPIRSKAGKIGDEANCKNELRANLPLVGSVGLIVSNVFSIFSTCLGFSTERISAITTSPDNVPAIPSCRKGDTRYSYSAFSGRLLHDYSSF